MGANVSANGKRGEGRGAVTEMWSGRVSLDWIGLGRVGWCGARFGGAVGSDPDPQLTGMGLRVAERRAHMVGRRRDRRHDTP